MAEVITLITFQKGLEIFLFPVVQSSLRFLNVKIIAVPATSFINDLVREGFDANAPCVLKNNLDINKNSRNILHKILDA